MGAGAELVDAVVVGSGFGGSVTAYRLAAAGLDVTLLERGRPYPPGSFARTPREMRRNFWDPSEGLQGLFDIWSFEGIDAVVSSGLGGGSLIYANVFIRKDERWFDRELIDGTREVWPVTRADLDPHYDAVAKIIQPTPYPFARAPWSETRKARAFGEAAQRAGLEWFFPDLAITFGADAGRPALGEQIPDVEVPGTGERIPNLHGMPRSTCRLTGECNVGCTIGAKNTLDFNYLTLARHHGADLRTRCEVRTFAPRPGGGWTVTYVEHADGADSRRLPERQIACRRLVLSAGTLGTTVLLLRAQARGDVAGLPPALGTRFSGNGDLLTFAANASEVIEAPFGPSITSTVRVPDAADGDGADGAGFYIQEGGYPAFASWIREVLEIPAQGKRLAEFVFGRVWRQLRNRPDSNISAEIAKLLSDGESSATLLPMLGMGRDTPDGRMSLDRDDGLARDWTNDTSEAYLKRVNETMKRISEEMGADWVQSPLRHLDRLITVHPLGGCPMGDEAHGVVDAFGRVHGQPGLHIADGSVMPGPVGPNPSFTIAALADRFATAMLEGS